MSFEFDIPNEPPVAPDPREAIRNQISREGGDVQSLLGTAGDGATLTLLYLAKLTVALSTVNSLAEIRDAAAEFEPLAQSFLDSVQSGDTRLPVDVKGHPEVLTEIELRSTVIADALSAPEDEQDF